MAGERVIVGETWWDGVFGFLYREEIKTILKEGYGDFRAQNSGLTMVSVQPEVPVDRSLFNLACHFDWQHMMKISPIKHYSNNDNIAYSPLYNVIVNVVSKTQNRCGK